MTMTNSSNTKYERGSYVNHKRFGLGKVEFDTGVSVIIRFEHGLEECEKSSLEVKLSPLEALKLEDWHIPLELITKIQAEAIQSANDSWGVFSRSKISLLPHQLWVCRKVADMWPTRCLVADDVGLGKTIEAGLILWSLIARSLVKRILILCPASLVEQWQYRLRSMFGINFVCYKSEDDNNKSEFWNYNDQVIASLHTLRTKNNDRHERLLNSSSWDLLIVDEAHHLNADEDSGATLGYRLVEKLVERNHVNSIIFFTGTPHRGKNYGFLALLKLLRPDLFDPYKPLTQQLSNLPEVVIRNNKQNVTDLKGERLFQEPKVYTETYLYTAEEQFFYDLLTEFIATGRAYASKLSEQDSRRVVLVLIALQKLASSSVAAIKKALKGRLARIKSEKKEIKDLEKKIEEYKTLEEYFDEDEINRIDEQIVELASSLKLLEDEEPFLTALIEAADNVCEETKINQILHILNNRFQNRQILFFTEYKATQSLLMSVLIKHYGNSSVTFINGDNKAQDVINSQNKVIAINESRENATNKFNNGEAKFLISTEAGGEGIDLQDNCYSMIHVDLPWNPMRLHQRAGRLNRYGQKEQVEIVILRNPETVEARIWDKLNHKIDQISLALNSVMQDPEDLKQLVLGMTSPSLFREIFSEANTVTSSSLSEWFDQKTAKFGGKDVLETVRNLVGHCAKFDYQEVSTLIPQVDLPDLKAFLTAILLLNHRQLNEEGDEFSFITPDIWKTDPLIKASYKNLTFNKNKSSRDLHKNLLGMGHKILDKAISNAKSNSALVCCLSSDILANPLIIFRVYDRITGEALIIRSIIVAVEVFDQEESVLLFDWQILKKLNSVISRKPSLREQTKQPSNIDLVIQQVSQAEKYLQNNLKSLEHPFKQPTIELKSVIWVEKKHIV